MTAGKVAEVLGVADIIVNHRVAEIPDETFDKNPISSLEYAKSGMNFKHMKQTKSEY